MGTRSAKASQDHEKCQSRQMAESRGARSDQNVMMKNTNLETRIQHAFICYDWFKIRTTNNIDTF
jgi:hypothetical protein